MHVKHPIWRKEKKIPETCVLSYYERARHLNDKKKSIRNTLYWKRKQYNQNVSFQYF